MFPSIAVPLAVIGLAGFYWSKWDALPAMPLAAGFGPGFFPAIITGFLVFVSILELIRVFSSHRKSTIEDQANHAAEETFSGWRVAGKDLLATGVLVAGVIGYAVLTPVLGFIPAAILMLVWLSLLMGLKPLWRSVLFSIVAAFGLYLVFHEFFGVSFPG